MTEPREPIAWGYYLFKDGTPVVFYPNDKDFENTKKNYVCLPLYNDEEIRKHLSTWNAGFNKKRRKIVFLIP